MFWAAIVLAFVFVFLIYQKHYLTGLLVVFFIGLTLRLLLPLHTSYPDYDAWNELSSVHYIKTFGFSLTGAHYYHSEIFVLQSFLLGLTTIFGDYYPTAFFAVIFGWCTRFLLPLQIVAEILNKVNTFYVMVLYSVMSIYMQSFSIPENFALPLGIASVYFFYNHNEHESFRNVAIIVLLYSLLVVTHHLTAFCTLLILGAWAFFGRPINRRRSRTLWLLLVAIFVGYWQVYQGFLTTILLKATPTLTVPLSFAPKPLWWWLSFSAALALLGLCLAQLFWVSFRQKKIRSEIPLACIVGLVVLFGALLLSPSTIYPARSLNQFGAYLAIGVFMIPRKRSVLLLKIFVILYLIGLASAYPIASMGNYYVGGNWLIVYVPKCKQQSISGPIFHKITALSFYLLIMLPTSERV